MDNTEILSQAISKIRGIEEEKALSIAQSMAKTQIIRAICEQSVILKTNQKNYIKMMLETEKTESYV
ncbi:MAG: hypothetical protein LBE13_19190 [Bacteroidales bacterium]|nr:hypothetical protein [Bacteroidales bacterium]